MPVSRAVCRPVTRPAAAASESCDALPAVIVPASVKAGRQRREALGRGVGAGCPRRGRARRRRRHRGDLLGQPPALGGRRRALVGRQRERVLGGAVDSEALVLPVGQLAHPGSGDAAPQAVVLHDVDQVPVARRGAVPHVDRVRRAGHRVEPAHQHARRLARADHPGRERHRAHARQADVVERDPGTSRATPPRIAARRPGFWPFAAWSTLPIAT